MVIKMFELLFILFVIGVFACVFAGGKSVVLALEWLTDQVRKIVNR